MWILGCPYGLCQFFCWKSLNCSRPLSIHCSTASGNAIYQPRCEACVPFQQWFRINADDGGFCVVVAVVNLGGPGGSGTDFVLGSGVLLNQYSGGQYDIRAFRLTLLLSAYLSYDSHDCPIPLFLRRGCPCTALPRCKPINFECLVAIW